MENYGGPKKNPENQVPHNRWVQEVLKNEGHVTPSPEVLRKVPSWRMIVNEKGEINVTS